MRDFRSVYERRVTGRNLIAGQETSDGPAWTGTSAVDGEALPTPFHDATEAEVAAAVTSAADALAERWVPPQDALAGLLRAAADELEADRDDLLAVVDGETALGADRVERELVRTVEQFRFHAAEVAEGSHLEATISRADPQAPGGARPDLRRMLVPVGPVGVFGASNFPLAFSVPGGDTASALAAGCPVVVKGHPAHPGTSELCARALARAVRRAGLPAGWLSLVQGRGVEVGRWLVSAAELSAVGFTGSLAGGRALADLAASRDKPIPVYAEMGSLNPMLVTRAALRARCEEIAKAFAGTLLANAGQFCTKPGLIFVPQSPERDAFARAVATAVEAGDPGGLLSEPVRERLVSQTRATAALPGVETVVERDPQSPGAWRFPATVLACDLATFRSQPALSEEHFGPVGLVVSYDRDDDLLDVAQRFDGTLASTLHTEEEDRDLASALVGVVARNSGRVIHNGVPTGVAVAHATHHGGPYPATTDALHTSVGSTALRRFLRPVAFQSMPPGLLPPALADDNPLGLLRNVEGRWTRAALADID